MSETQISINDMATMCEIIKVCSSRGAFLPEELEPIGKIYNKLMAFVKEHTAPKEPVVPVESVNDNKNSTPLSPLSKVQNAGM
uniref:Uncharacterized protein n=1 Tax=viral metagenome TaxID=1070528 RepID=A0A6C0EJY6_9ZZZZ